MSDGTSDAQIDQALADLRPVPPGDAPAHASGQGDAPAHASGQGAAATSGIDAEVAATSATDPEAAATSGTDPDDELDAAIEQASKAHDVLRERLSAIQQ
ncbi:hypothetical protein [Metallococcus carri]|uniref:hypothetical protein n=1 Tax=Metallococcus carri TaxID=1656884 RepID=UPI001F344068|nr:hypothetical protein [Metallococcus carri]